VGKGSWFVSGSKIPKIPTEILTMAKIMYGKAGSIFLPCDYKVRLVNRYIFGFE